MQLYLQSAVVERGVREDELAKEEREAVAGAVFANIIAAFIIIATGATLFTHGVHSISSAADAARSLAPFAGEYAEVLFGVGLLGASLLAAAILPIATSYVVSESLGYEKGIGRRREEAPVFMNIITAMILISTFVAIIPGLPVISLLVGVQVVNGLLLPINLFFIWRLSRSRALMGEQRSHGALPRALIARLARPVRLGESDHPVDVDQEGPAQRHARLLEEHVIGLRDRPVRPEIGQQRETVALHLRPGPERLGGVGGDRQHLHAFVLKGAQVVPQLAQLSRTPNGERERIEHQQHGLLPAERRQAGRGLVRVGQGEIGRLRADRESHQRRTFPDLGRASRAIIHCGPPATLVVCANPAVRVASAISLGST